MINAEDLQTCRNRRSRSGSLATQKISILTHCNAGALATAGYGTALGVVALREGRLARVYADETVPLTGAKLTAWECARRHSITVITDNMAAHMQRGLIDAVVVGADRIAANGIRLIKHLQSSTGCQGSQYSLLCRCTCQRLILSSTGSKIQLKSVIQRRFIR